MKLLWVALAAVLLAGCAVVPAPYPDPYVVGPSVGVGVGIGVPVYRGGYGHYHHPGWRHGPYRRW